jgi:hypothetical protein
MREARYKVKNWEHFQHFKDRRPPWIKLYREVLEQRDIALLSDRNFRVLVGLWLLASEDREMDGSLPPVEDIAFRLRISKADTIKALDGLSDFLICDDINMISGRYQDDAPETETETEKKTEKEADAFSFNKCSTSVAFDTFWSAYGKKVSKGQAQRAFDRAIKKAALETMLTAIEAQRNTDKWRNGYQENPATWLNGEGWENDPTAMMDKSQSKAATPQQTKSYYIPESERT